MTVLFYILLVLGLGLVGFVVIVAVRDPQLKCWWNTEHANSECLGSIYTKHGPRFAYRCRDCGAITSEPWE